MKKVIIIFAVIFCAVVLTSCTDNTEELEENIMLSDLANKSFSDKDEEPDRD